MDLVNRVLILKYAIMKKIRLFLGMLLSLGMFSACSSSDEIDNESDVLNNLTSIDEGDSFVVLSDFFKTTFATEGEEAFDFKNNLSNEENPCIAINNEEDFKEAYTGDLNLPAIDFSKYTLIIGKTFLSAGTFIDNVNIKTNPVKTTLSINCIIDTNPNVGYLGVSYWEYYWKLFLKFHSSRIFVEISKEKGIVDDSKKQYE